MPLRPVLFEIVRDCMERGKAPGTACPRLLLSRWSWVRAAKDEMDAGIEPESELEERSLLTHRILANRRLKTPSTITYRTSKELCKV